MDDDRTGAPVPDNAWKQVVASLADAGRLEVLARVVTEGPAEAVLSADERRRLAPLLAAGVVVREETGFLRAAPERFAALLVTAPTPRPTGPDRSPTAGRLPRMPERVRERALAGR
mgnify:CR=1 FL=1